MSRGARRVEEAIRQANERGEAALVPFIEAGDPELAVTEDLLWHLAEAGAEVIELGFPFSDPLADGPTIQEAAQRALRHPFSLDEVLTLISRMRARGFETPVLLMGYANPFFRYGLAPFAQRAREAGLDGAIIPDLPLEEARPWLREARKRRLAAVMLAAPTTPPERLERIAAASSGFLYYVSVTGITGAREELPRDLALRLDLARELSPVPVGVGFGISRPEQVRLLAPHADAIVVGSAIVRIIGRLADDPTTMVREVSSFVRALKEATARP